MIRSGLGVLASLVVTALIVVSCSSADGGSAKVAEYERVWPDGFTEVTTIFEDGRVTMFHGDRLERITISSGDIERLQEALLQPLEEGSAEDSPKRTLTLGDGTVVSAPRPVPASAIDLLDRLTSTHSLDRSVPIVNPVDPGASPAA